MKSDTTLAMINTEDKAPFTIKPQQVQWMMKGVRNSREEL